MPSTKKQMFYGCRMRRAPVARRKTGIEGNGGNEKTLLFSRFHYIIKKSGHSPGEDERFFQTVGRHAPRVCRPADQNSACRLPEKRRGRAADARWRGAIWNTSSSSSIRITPAFRSRSFQVILPPIIRMSITTST